MPENQEPINYARIVRYNNISALSKLALGVPWTLGYWSARVGCKGEEYSSSDVDELKKIKNKASKDFLANSNYGCVEIVVNVLSAVKLMPGLPHLTPFNFILDYMGLGTGEKFGAFYAGYERGRLAAVTFKDAHKHDIM